MRNLFLLLYCVYLYFFYHLLVIPAFAEFSYYAFLVVPLFLLGFWLVPPERRKEIVVFTFLFLFMDQAIANIFFQKIRTISFVWVAFVGLFLFPIVKYYARVRLPAMIIALVLALSFNLFFPDRTILALPHLYPKWSSEKVYIGHVTESFPLAVVDMDQDGLDEIITLGNRDFYPDGLRKAKYSYLLEDEPLHLMVWTWKNDSLVRVPHDTLDVKVVREYLPADFIAFPYYVLNDDLVLEPLVQRQSLTESMLRFGAAPFQALRLNLEHIERQLQSGGHLYDTLEQSGAYKQVELNNGSLTGTYDGTPFEIDSSATKIIGTIGLEGGGEGLLVLGLDVQLLQWNGSEMEFTHTLTREMQNSLALSRFITDDLNHNGKQELIVTFPYSTILEPTDSGGWDILWSTEEKSFHIKDIGSFDAGAGERSNEILALHKSMVRASDVSYLTSYHYDDHQLEQNWKVFMRNIETAQFGDLDGDGTNELITTITGKHKVYVWGKHSIPVTGILIGLTLLLILYLAGRRVSYAKQQKAQKSQEQQG